MNGQEQKTPADGISPDGYIVDQDCFSSVRYRRHYLGHEVGWDEVRTEMDAMHTLRVPGPTLMRVMRGYLSRYVPGYRETSGREEALTAAEESEAGIFRYREGDTPHFICYLRQDDGQFRFFNVDDNIDDGVMSMQKFGREHFLRGNVIALTIQATTISSSICPMRRPNLSWSSPG